MIYVLPTIIALMRTIIYSNDYERTKDFITHSAGHIDAHFKFHTLYSCFYERVDNESADRVALPIQTNHRSRRQRKYTRVMTIYEDIKSAMRFLNNANQEVIANNHKRL